MWQKEEIIMEKQLNIAVDGTGARDIIGSTKKTYDN
jgi:predicted RNA-binding protein